MPKSRSRRLALCFLSIFFVHRPKRQCSAICKMLDDAQSPNQISSKIRGLVCKISLGKSPRLRVSQTKATPETAMLATATIVPPVKTPHFFAFKPRGWLFKFLT